MREVISSGCGEGSSTPKNALGKYDKDQTDPFNEGYHPPAAVYPVAR